MDENCRLPDRWVFHLLFQMGLIGLVCLLFFNKYGVVMIFISMVTSVILIPPFSVGKLKKVVFKDEREGEKKSNNWPLLLLPRWFLFSLWCYYAISDQLTLKIDYEAWIVGSSIIYFWVVTYLFINRVVH